jgi:hypothetical protein
MRNPDSFRYIPRTIQIPANRREELWTADDIFLFILIFYELWKQIKYIDSSLTTCFCEFLNVLYFLTIFFFIDIIDVYSAFFTN